MSEERTAWGWGLASVDAAGTTLDVWYPELNLGEAPAESDRPNHNFGTLAHDEADARGIRRVPVFVVSQLDEPISNAADAYLKLHLMSMRMAKPNTLNLDGIFAQLANVVWTNYGPFAVEDFTLRKADVERASTEAALAFASQAGLPAAAPAATVNVFEWFDDPQIKHSPDGTQFEVIVDAPERAVFWWALQYSWDGRVVILEPDSLKRKLYDAGRRMATAYAPE